MTYRSTTLIRSLGILSGIFLGCAGGADTFAGAIATPPGYSLAGTGTRQDFSFLAGAWTTSQRQLKVRGVGNSDWKDAPANVHCATPYLGGVIIAEESYSPAKAVSGLFLYTFDLDKRQWSLYWIDPKSGKLESPVIGGFKGDRGEFYGEDVDGGRPIKVRYTWIKQDHDHARWEQAFSYDNQSWETNWITDFTRSEPAASCPRSS